MKMEKILQSIVLIAACVASCEGVAQVLLESSPNTSVPVCPDDDALVFTCNATEFGSVEWYRDGTSFFTINSGGGTSGTPPDGLQVVVNSVQQSGPNPTLADFISTLTVDNTTLVGGSEICCGVLTVLDACINVTLKTTSAPTIVSIREETVRSVNITLGEPAEGSECVEDYTIQYEGESVSTGGNLSVVIEDTVLCSVAPVTFNVTAVLRDGSLISGNEFNFNLSGKTLDKVMNVSVEGLRVTWDEPESTCDCVDNYIIRYYITENDSDFVTADCGGTATLPLSPNPSECIRYFVTVTPVLINGAVVETSRSDPASFVLGQEGFSSPNITSVTYVCSEDGVVTVTWDTEGLAENVTSEVTYGLTSDCLNGNASDVENGRATLYLPYGDYLNEEVSICVTFRSGPCKNTASTIVRVENIINRTSDDGDITTAEVTVFFNDCNNGSESNRRSVRATDGSSNLMIMIQAFETSDPGKPAFDPITVSFPESSLRHQQSLEDLDPNTNYTYNVRVVRTMDNALIGVPANDSVETENASSERTGLIIGDALLALIYIIAVVVAVVLILLTWWKYRTRDCSLNLDTLLKELKEVEGDWKQLGECLGVSPSQLDEIAKQCSTAAECMVEMLDVWIRNHVGHPTWKEVIVGLGKLNRYHLAESLKHRYTTVSLRWWQLVILVCGAVLLVVSIILLILVIVELSEDIVEEVEDGGTIGLVAASYIISAVTAVLWIVLIFLAPKWITGHSLCERSVDEPDSGEKPRKKSKRKSKTAPEEIPMTGEHYGKLQRPGMMSPTEPLEEPSTYATLDMGEADVTTGQQEYAVARHGPKPQGVANINDPNYGHLNEGEAAQPEYDVAQHGRPKPRRGGPEVPGRGAEPGYGRLDQATRMKEYEEVSQAPRYKPRDSGRRQ